MDREHITALRSGVVPGPARETLLQSGQRLRVWNYHVNELPVTLTRECTDARLVRRLYYPYWRLALEAKIKTLLLPPRRLEFFPSVDAVTGQLCVVLAGEETSVIDTEGVSTYLVPNVLTEESIDEERVYQTVRVLASKRLRSWSTLSLEIQATTLVHKRVDLYAVTPKRGPDLLVAMDTVSGEYGIVH